MDFYLSGVGFDADNIAKIITQEVLVNGGALHTNCIY